MSFRKAWGGQRVYLGNVATDFQSLRGSSPWVQKTVLPGGGCKKGPQMGRLKAKGIYGVRTRGQKLEVKLPAGVGPASLGVWGPKRPACPVATLLRSLPSPQPPPLLGRAPTLKSRQVFTLVRCAETLCVNQATLPSAGGGFLCRGRGKAGNADSRRNSEENVC